MMRVAALASGCLLLGAAGALVSSAHGSASQSVSLSFVRFFDQGCNCFKARVSGQVSNGRAGELVVVLEEYCGRGSGRSVVAATTREGGAWQAEIPIVARPDAGIAVSYRARWNNVLSAPVVFRGQFESLSGRRVGRVQQVTVVTPNVNPINLKGRAVVLQRRASGAWRRVGSARLARHRTRFYTFVASFTAPRRGWTLRALVPAKTAAPCFGAQASEPWVS